MSYYQNDGQPPVHRTTRGAKAPGGCLLALALLPVALIARWLRGE